VLCREKRHQRSELGLSQVSIEREELGSCGCGALPVGPPHQPANGHVGDAVRGKAPGHGLQVVPPPDLVAVLDAQDRGAVGGLGLVFARRVAGDGVEPPQRVGHPVGA
jgi:hypothetical protein